MKNKNKTNNKFNNNSNNYYNNNKFKTIIFYKIKKRMFNLIIISKTLIVEVQV